ncbi:MAG TPA: hypothetical protein VF796_29110 [Humisphaera sp.]
MNRSFLIAGVWVAWFSVGLLLTFGVVALAIAVLVVATARGTDPAGWWAVAITGSVAAVLFLTDRYLARLYRRLRPRVPIVPRGFDVVPSGAGGDRPPGGG